MSRAVAQYRIYLRNIRRPPGASLAYRAEHLLQHAYQELLAFHISQSALTVMLLHLIKARIVARQCREHLISAEGIEICEDHIALHLSGIRHIYMIGIGIHAHNLLLERIEILREIYAVAEGFGHLRPAVDARKPARRLIGQQYIRLYEHIAAVCGIELAHYLTRLLYHRLLILAYRNRSRLKCRDIGSL